ncbi:MAG TPA: 23S rRNA (adenine(2503)-C(2))-methyltransferase RlmN [Polyangiaceae bacterium]|nr:23S rRNA (adenine(2503)-C(2))-methyltransferase RlmN [Polyangiaceae bacterium]
MKDATAVVPIARLPEEWALALSEWGERPYRARQIFQWIHKRGVLDPALMTDLGKPLRERLAQSGLEPPARVVHVYRSADGTRKLLLEMAEGARVECVIIPMTRAAGDALAPEEEEESEDGETAFDRERVTLCVSTQFGCAMGCAFCASGQAGLMRGLGAHEIVAQVILSRQYLEPHEDLRNLVFMGMGEPLHHYDQTARALRLLTHPDGGNMGPRRITVSTVGLVPGIRKLGADFEGKIGLAISLHAPNDATRDRIIPMNQRYPLQELLRALHEYPLPKRRRITIEYTLIAGINDSSAHASELVNVLRGLRVKVNLIPMNGIRNSELTAPDDQRVEAFRDQLVRAGLSCFLRTRRGDDVAAACGQLAMADELVSGRKLRVVPELTQ